MGMQLCACGGSSPVTPSIWFDQALLNFHALLTPMGVSATNFAQVLDGMAVSFRSMECGVAYPPPLDDRHLTWATYVHGTQLHSLEDIEQLAGGEQ